jgi:hypothetical protein
MKHALLSSAILFSLFILIFSFQTSCKKETVNTVTKSDTIYTCIPVTKDSILIQKTWKVAQLHHVISGVFSSYTSGGTNTTGINYDLLRFTFKKDGTGTHIDANGTLHTFTWQFITPDKLSMKINLDTGISITWQMVQIASNYLNASVQLTVAGNPNNIETFQLIQIP